MTSRAARGPVVVIGGGIVGLCTAYALARRGTDVTVLDRRDAAPPASWGNAGWVVPCKSAPLPAPGIVRHGLRALADPAAPLRIPPRLDGHLFRWLWTFARNATETRYRDGFEATIRLARDAPARYDQLAHDGVEFDMWHDGLTYATRTRAAAATELARLQPLARHGYQLPTQVLDIDELRGHEPTLSDTTVAGFHVSQERHADPRTLLAGLHRWLTTNGVTVTTGMDVAGCTVRNGKVVGVMAADERLPASAVVIAAGAWSGELTAQLRCHLPLVGGKGYSFVAEGAPRVASPLYLVEARTAITPFDTDVRVAGTMELDGMSRKVRPGRIQAILAAAERHLRGWEHVTVRQQWAGLRPMTTDGLPVVGRIPGIGNAYVATGHAMLGLTLGPATGEHLARLVLTGETPVELEPFAADRFSRTRSRCARETGVSK